jgi:hypothetical protein
MSTVAIIGAGIGGVYLVAEPETRWPAFRSIPCAVR